MKKYIWCDTYGGFNLEFTQDQVSACSHQGECYDDCAVVANEINDQLKNHENHRKIDLLLECGAWEKDELQDENENDIKIVWIACNDIKEDTEMYTTS